LRASISFWLSAPRPELSELRSFEPEIRGFL